MFCQKCGKEIKDDAMFCQSCGQPVSGASMKAVQNTKNVNKNAKSSEFSSSIINDSKKLMLCGVGIIAILLIVIICLVAGGKKDKSDNGKTEANAKEGSQLAEILGDWEKNSGYGYYNFKEDKSISDADSFARCEYINIVPEGIQAFDNERDYLVNEIDATYYTVDVNDVEVKTEDGITYYYYEAIMIAKRDYEKSKEKMQNRLYINDEGLLVNDIYIPGESKWRTLADYKLFASNDVDISMFDGTWSQMDDDSYVFTLEGGKGQVRSDWYDDSNVRYAYDGKSLVMKGNFGTIEYYYYPDKDMLCREDDSAEFYRQ